MMSWPRRAQAEEPGRAGRACSASYRFQSDNFESFIGEDNSPVHFYRGSDAGGDVSFFELLSRLDDCGTDDCSLEADWLEPREPQQPAAEQRNPLIRDAAQESPAREDSQDAAEALSCSAVNERRDVLSRSAAEEPRGPQSAEGQRRAARSRLRRTADEPAQRKAVQYKESRLLRRRPGYGRFSAQLDSSASDFLCSFICGDEAEAASLAETTAWSAESVAPIKSFMRENLFKQHQRDARVQALFARDGPDFIRASLGCRHLVSKAKNGNALKSFVGPALQYVLGEEAFQALRSKIDRNKFSARFCRAFIAEHGLAEPFLAHMEDAAARQRFLQALLADSRRRVRENAAYWLFVTDYERRPRALRLPMLPNDLAKSFDQLLRICRAVRPRGPAL